MADFSLLLESSEFTRIRAAASAGRSVHAYIIEGEAGMGKFSLALLLSAALLCSAGSPPCLECSSCKRVLLGDHPDVHVFTGAKKNISADEMRALSERSIESSYEGGKRIFIIKNAHSMTAAAQNCLLKTLEEPEGSAIFILLAASSMLLLPTIRSRCRRIMLSEPPIAAIAAQLERLGYPPDKSMRAATVCGGNIGRAISICSSAASEYADIALRLLQQADRGSLTGVTALLIKSKDYLPQVLQNLESLISAQLQKNPSDLKSLVRINEIICAQNRIKGNINYGLLTDKLARGLVTGETIWQR